MNPFIPSACFHCQSVSLEEILLGNGSLAALQCKQCGVLDFFCTHCCALQSTHSALCTWKWGERKCNAKHACPALNVCSRHIAKTKRPKQQTLQLHLFDIPALSREP